MGSQSELSQTLQNTPKNYSSPTVKGRHSLPRNIIGLYVAGFAVVVLAIGVGAYTYFQKIGPFSNQAAGYSSTTHQDPYSGWRTYTYASKKVGNSSYSFKYPPTYNVQLIYQGDGIGICAPVYCFITMGEQSDAYDQVIKNSVGIFEYKDHEYTKNTELQGREFDFTNPDGEISILFKIPNSEHSFYMLAATSPASGVKHGFFGGEDSKSSAATDNTDYSPIFYKVANSLSFKK